VGGIIMDKKIVITIARGYGSGGKTVGQMIAKELGISFYDRQILYMASDDSGINVGLFQKNDEDVNKGLFDPSTHKYLGGIIPPEDAGFDKEIFSFLYLLTDNTGMRLEKSVFIVAAQPTTADLTIYNSEKGDNSCKEISVEFNGFPIMNDDVDRRALDVLNWIINPSNPNRMHLNSNDFSYTGQADIEPH
jgi:hypothetical protein